MKLEEVKWSYWRPLARIVFDLLLVGILVSAICWAFNSYMLNLELHGTTYESYEKRGKPLSIMFKVKDHHPSSSGYGIASPRREIVERCYLWKQRWFEGMVWFVFGTMGMYVIQRASGNHQVSNLLPNKLMIKIYGGGFGSTSVATLPSDCD